MLGTALRPAAKDWAGITSASSRARIVAFVRHVGSVRRLVDRAVLEAPEERARAEDGVRERERLRVCQAPRDLCQFPTLSRKKTLMTTP